MPWVYQQSTGNFYDENNTLLEKGYSGKDPHKDNPDSQGVANYGPIPRGRWRIGAHTNSKGPYTIILTPEPGTNTFGRSAFRIHGDSISNPGNASQGCIILKQVNRLKVIGSSDRILEVVE